MRFTNDVDFIHRGHHVQVSHQFVPAEFQGVNDMRFTVLVDGAAVDIPGIWSAYKKASTRGVELVIMAMLDGVPAKSS